MNNLEIVNNTRPTKKFRVDIWSDIVCPFCYIGKRHFEQALKQTGLSDSAEIIWHSFELDPGAKTAPDLSIYEELGRRKGWSKEQSKQIHDQVTERARQAELEYDFDKTIPANSRNAHRILHLAKKHGVQNKVKELLFRGYFTDGANIDDEGFLVKTGKEAGLTEKDILHSLVSDDIDLQIEQDIESARKIGIQGVPFFVLNEKYAVSGAQPVDVFVQVLEKVKEEEGIKPLTDFDSAFCGPDGTC